MAKVVQADQEVIVKPWWEKLSILYVGLGAGLSWWGISSILHTYILEPIACQGSSVSVSCGDSFGIAGSIAAVLVATAATFALIRLVQPRPVVIAVGSAVLLWDLAVLAQGLGSLEVLGWSLVLYTATYLLFWLIARIPSTIVCLVSALAVIAIVRLLLVL